MFIPVELFLKVPAADLVIALNDLVNDINGNFESIGYGYDGTVSLRQFKLALAAGGHNQTVINGIPASADDPVYIAWTSASSVTPNDALAVNVQGTLGYTSAQMVALFALAEAQAP
jgi:hypothetical protein